MTEIEVSRRERKKEETKERIYNAAIKLFKQKGFEATTVDDITDRADVGKGTFFNYFPRKEAVFGYLSERWVEEAEQRADEIMASGGRTSERLLEMFIDFAAFYEEDRELSRHVVLDWQWREQTGCDAVCARWDELGMRVVRYLQENGEVRRDVAADTAAEIFASVHKGTILRWLAAPKAPFALREGLRRRLNVVFEGLAPREVREK